MVFKLENSTINIDGKSVFKGLVATYIIVKLYRAARSSKEKYYATLDAELKRIKKEQKLTDKKSKVESI